MTARVPSEDSIVPMTMHISRFLKGPPMPCGYEYAHAYGVT